MRYGQIVMGPAGSGKSTYCSAIVKHCEAKKRVVRVVNLDPAAEHFSYPVEADVRDLVQVDDVMEDEELKLGPNGSLIFCMEYLVQNLEWLEEQLGDEDDDYILFDCPGQIELYTHLPIMKQLVSALQQRWNFRLCGVFLLDSQFLVDPTKFFSGVLVTLSAMVGLELPQINVFSKMDLFSKSTKGEDIDKFLDPDVQTLLSEMSKSSSMSKKYHKLNKAIATLIEDYSLVQLLSLDVTEEDSIDRVLIYVDNTIQYGEDLDVKVPRLEDDIDEQDDSGI